LERSVERLGLSMRGLESQLERRGLGVGLEWELWLALSVEKRSKILKLSLFREKTALAPGAENSTPHGACNRKQDAYRAAWPNSRNDTRSRRNLEGRTPVKLGEKTRTMTE